MTKFTKIFYLGAVLAVAPDAFSQGHKVPKEDPGMFTDLGTGLKPEDCLNCGTKPVKCDQEALKHYDSVEFGQLWTSLSSARLRSKDEDVKKACLDIGGAIASSNVYTGIWFKGDAERAKKIRSVIGIGGDLGKLRDICSSQWDESKRAQFVALIDGVFARINNIQK